MSQIKPLIGICKRCGTAAAGEMVDASFVCNLCLNSPPATTTHYFTFTTSTSNNSGEE